MPEFEPLPGDRAHGGVVGAQRLGRQEHPHPTPATERLERFPQQGVRRDAPAHHHDAAAGLLDRELDLRQDRVHHRLLKCGGEVGSNLARGGRCVAHRTRRPHEVSQGGLQAAETQVETVAVVRERPRQAMRPRVAAGGGGLDLGPAGIAEAEQARRLVEGLARRVVDRAAQPFGVERAADVKQRRVAAAGHEPDTGLGQRLAVREPAGVEVGEDVVVADDRHAQHRRERLSRREPHEERADEARPHRHGHRLEVASREARPGDRLVDHGDDPLHVRPRRHLGHHAPPAGVKELLGRHDARQHRPVAGDHRGGGLVAGTLDGEQWHGPTRRAEAGPGSRGPPALRSRTTFRSRSGFDSPTRTRTADRTRRDTRSRP